MESSPGEITRLLSELQNGNAEASDRLIPLIYAELHRLAASYMRRERRSHTLQATALVNEAYLRLVRQQAGWRSRAHFFAVAAQLMRRILVDHARACCAEKRGSGAQRLSLEEAALLSDDQATIMLDLDRALCKLV